MSKIQIKADGSHRVIKTFHHDQMYLRGMVVSVEKNTLASELEAKGLIEKVKVEIAKPKRGRKRKSKDA